MTEEEETKTFYETWNHQKKNYKENGVRICVRIFET